MLSTWVKAEVLPALRALNLADVITLDIRAALSDADGEIAERIIDRGIEKFLAAIEQRAEPLAMPVRDTFKDRGDRRPAHTTLADRNAHLIEQFLVADGRLRRPRLLSPGVTDLFGRA